MAASDNWQDTVMFLIKPISLRAVRLGPFGSTVSILGRQTTSTCFPLWLSDIDGFFVSLLEPTAEGLKSPSGFSRLLAGANNLFSVASTVDAFKARERESLDAHWWPLSSAVSSTLYWSTSLAFFLSWPSSVMYPEWRKGSIVILIHSSQSSVHEVNISTYLH